MENNRLDTFHYVPKDRVNKDEESVVNDSQNKTHINATSDSESHMSIKGRSNKNRKKNCCSNGLQFSKERDIIVPQVQSDTSNIRDTSPASVGHVSKANSYFVLTEKHLKDEKSSKKNSSFYVEDLSAEDEIYTFQCPENYIKQNLVNQTFDFGKINKMVDAKTNEVLQLNVLSVEKKSLTIAVPKKGKTGVLINLPLKGHILIKRIVKTPFHHQEITHEDSFTCGTDNKLLMELKSRHPLLGINWKAHIDLADEAFKRQNKKIKREMKINLNVKKTENSKRVKNFEAESLCLKKKRKTNLK